MKKRFPPGIAKFPAAKQRRLDELLDKNSQGTLTSAESARLKVLVEEAEKLMVENGKRMAEFIAHEPPVADAVPLTVWVSPHTSLDGTASR